MIRLAVDRHVAQMHSLNVRAEKFGKETRKAIDVGLSLAFTGDVLKTFHPQLHELLFDASSTDLAGGAMVRYPKLGNEFEWADEMTGAKVQFPIGTKPVDLPDAKVNKFKIAPQEGGGVILSMRVQGYPGPGDIDRLAEYLQLSIEVSITPAELPAMEPPPKKKTKTTKAEAEQELAKIAATSDGAPVAPLIKPEPDALKSASEALAAGEQVH